MIQWAVLRTILVLLYMLVEKKIRNNIKVFKKIYLMSFGEIENKHTRKGKKL